MNGSARLEIIFLRSNVVFISLPLALAPITLEHITVTCKSVYFRKFGAQISWEVRKKEDTGSIGKKNVGRKSFHILQRKLT